MFREMRRSAQRLPEQETLRLLQKGTSGVLAVQGDDGYPYAVPLNYVYRHGRLYFHCAAQGHKLDAIRACDKASFCVIVQDEVDAKNLTTLYRSVIAFGRARETQGEEKRQAAEWLAERFAPAFLEKARQATQSSWERLCVIALDIEHLTGKEARKLAERRGEKE